MEMETLRPCIWTGHSLVNWDRVCPVSLGIFSECSVTSQCWNILALLVSLSCHLCPLQPNPLLTIKQPSIRSAALLGSLLTTHAPLRLFPFSSTPCLHRKILLQALCLLCMVATSLGKSSEPNAGTWAALASTPSNCPDLRGGVCPSLPTSILQQWEQVPWLSRLEKELRQALRGPILVGQCCHLVVLRVSAADTPGKAWLCNLPRAACFSEENAAGRTESILS